MRMAHLKKIQSVFRNFSEISDRFGLRKKTDQGELCICKNSLNLVHVLIIFRVRKNWINRFLECNQFQMY